MAKSILQTYEEKQAEIGLDKVSFSAKESAKTPYSLDDNKNADEQVLNAERFKVGRGGQVNNVLYSSTVDRSK